MTVSAFSVLAAAALVFGVGSANVYSSSSSGVGGRLYFTTFAPAAVDEASFEYHAGRLRISRPRRIARLPGADGILFDPAGRLLVGGARTGELFEVNPADGSHSVLRRGLPGAMHLTLSASGRTLFTSSEPGTLAAITLGALGGKDATHLSGKKHAITAVAFGPGHQAMYTSSTWRGRGDIGLINVQAGTIEPIWHAITGAHGVVYDAWSHSYIAVGGDAILQIAASDPTKIESELLLPGNRFDQASVTGQGQVLVASNLGSAVFVDYSGTGLVGDLANTVAKVHVALHLDDVAPLIGPGAPPPLRSAGRLRLVGGMALVAVAVAGVAAAALARRCRRHAGERPRLPRWDRRHVTSVAAVRSRTAGRSGLV